MKDLKKLLSKEEGSPEKMDARSAIKMKALKELSDEMSSISGNSLLESMAPKASVTVATDDPKKLPEALEEAKDIAEDLPKMPMMEMEEDESEEDEMDESEDMDVDSLTLEQLKEKVKQLMMK